MKKTFPITAPAKYLIGIIVAGSALALSGCGPTPQVDESPHGSGDYPIRYDYNVDGEIWFRNSGIQLRFDSDMYCRVFLRSAEKLYSINDIPPYEEKAKPPDFLVIKGKELKDFTVDYRDIGASEMKTQLGVSKRFNLTGYAETADGIPLRKNLKIDFYKEFPQLALISVSYMNSDSKRTLPIDRFYTGFYRMDATRGGESASRFLFQSMFGSPSRIQQLSQNSSMQEEVIGSQAEGPKPLLDLWCKSMGMATGMIPEDHQPATLLLQVAPDERVEMGLELKSAKELKPGETFTLPRTFLLVHEGDSAGTVKTYNQLLQKLRPSFPYHSGQ